MRGGIKLIAWRSICINKKRAAIVCMAIIMTAILFTTVISITLRINQADQLSKQLATGSDFHASVYDITAEQAEQIITNKVIKDFYIVTGGDSIQIQDTKYEDSMNPPELFSCEDSTILNHMFSHIVKGSYPKNNNEILLDIDYLNKMNIPAIIGSKVSFYVGEDDNKRDKRTYVLSGYFTTKTDRYATKPAFTINQKDEYVSVYLMLNNSLNLKGKVKKILSDLNLDATYEVNEAYSLANKSLFDLKSVALFISVAAVVFFSGFLLIYNIYYIMLERDVQFYGLLKTIGTSSRQLKEIVFFQVNFLYVISMPLGLVLGYIIGWKVLSPIFMTLEGSGYSYNFNIFIFLFTIVFTYVTAVSSAVLPVKKIIRLSCIDALIGKSKTTSKLRMKHSENGAKPLRMAISNLRRGAKKNFIMISSISLSIILFMFIYTTVNILSTFRNTQIADFCIEDDSEVTKAYDDTEGKPYYMEYNYRLTEQIVEKIRNMKGVNSVIPIYTTTVIADIDEMVAKRVYSGPENSSTKELIRVNTKVNNQMVVYVYGIPNEAVGYLEERCLSDNFNVKRFKEGGYALVNSFHLQGENDLLSYYLPEETISLNILKKQYKVLAIGKPGRALVDDFIVENTYPIISLDIYLPYHEFIKEFSKFDILSINIFSENQSKDLVEAQLKSTLKTNVVIMDKREQIKEFQNRLNSIQIVGYSLCLIVFLIGILNYMNTIICKMHERRMELSLLEIVGMTRKQLIRMLIYESLLYIVMSSLISLIFGIPLIKILLNVAFESDVVIHVNMLPFIFMMVFMMLVGIASTMYSYYVEARLSLVERLCTSAV